MGQDCPRCSGQKSAGQDRVAPVSGSQSAAISESQHETAQRWQQELKRRVAERARSQAATEAAAMAAAQEAEPEAQAVPAPTGAEPAAAFNYKMGDASQRTYPRPVKTEKPVLSDQKLVRAAKANSLSEADPRQGTLVLDSETSQPIAEPMSDDSADEVDREVLFSRFLCGIIDLSLPVLTGFLFTVGGAWILDFDYFLSAALEWAAAFSLFFFFFNSLFFLTLMGQTPGMYVTELRLVSDSGQAPSLRQLVLRVLLFLPSVLSLAGLAWALLDPSCRTAHDRFSSTRVEAFEQPSL